MGRRFLSSLRGSAPTGLEAKGFPTSTFTVGPSLSRSSSSLYGEDRAAGWDMEAVIAEGYERSVWTYRCVELISGSQSRLPFRIGRDIDGDDMETLDDHPLYRVLNKRANPLETGRQFRKRLSALVLLSKRGAFVEVTRSRAGTITRLDLLDPARVIPIPSDSGDYLDYFEYTRRDGEVREIAPERIRWVREPHPTDPFCGTTPLEAAGLSVELDQLARVYNSSFIKNDSKPGGILAVDVDTLRDAEMERLEKRFKPGAHNAGELAVVASGPGGLKYVDTTTRPRDMAYTETAKNAKNEILTAFGIDESLLGNVGGRTFDNAEQAQYTYWATDPMPAHLDLIAGAFADDIDGDWEPYLDTAKVEALEVGQRKRRTEAREEYNAGLRSIDEYRPLSKLDPIANPQSRALWISPAKAPVPSSTPGDAAALLGGEGAGPAGAAAPVDPNAPAGEVAPAEAVTAADVVDAAEGDDAALDQAVPGGPAAAVVDDARAMDEVVPPPGGAAQAVDLARDVDEATDVNAAVTALSAVLDADALEDRLEDRMEGKALAPATGQPDEAAPVQYEPAETATTAAEVALTAALAAMLARQRGVITARVSAPKARKGTRFWRADGDADTRGGDAPMDMEKVVDAARWATEAVETTSPLIQSAVVDAALALLDAFAGAGALPGMGEEDQARFAGATTAAVSLALMVAVEDAMTGYLGDLRVHLDAHQQAADSITELIGAVDEFYADRADKFTRGFAGDLAHTAVQAATHTAAVSLTPTSPVTGIVRTWITRRDDKVRDTHRAVDGTTLPVGEPFTVGGFAMAHPQDPTAAPHERYGCRCRCRYATARGATFTTEETPA